jgi:hypothetical protein
MKLKFLVAALAFAAASPTFAAIADGSTGNGQLFMSVWDPVAQTSYIRNLNVDMNTFIANGNTSGYSLSYAADSVLSGAYNLATNTNLVYNVAALDSTGGTAVGGQRYLSTTNATQAVVQQTSNSNLTAGFSAVNGYVNATALNPADSSTWTAADSSAYFGSGFKTNWNGKASFNSTAAVGTDLNFYALQASSTSGLAKIAGTPSTGSWNLGTNGTLSYSVAAVPLPPAVWLLGSGLIGMVGVARRSRAKTAA